MVQHSSKKLHKPVALLKRILELGIHDQLTLDRVKNVRIINSLSLVLLTLTVFYWPQILSEGHIWLIIYYFLIPLIYIAAIYLNFKHYYRNATLLVVAFSLFYAFSLVPIFGAQIPSYLWFFPIGLGFALLFPSDEEITMYLVSGITIVLFAISYFFSSMIEPMVILSDPGDIATKTVPLAALLVTIFVSIVLRKYVLGTESSLMNEQERSERLLLNILPGPIAGRLKDNHNTIADACPDVTVMFADISGFTRISETLPASEVVELLNRVFTKFDMLAEKYHLEKIKTIGDAYMVAGGVPEKRDDHAEAIANMALDMLTVIEGFENKERLEIRIGINSGAVVAGVIGIKKFIYDLWGDTVNIASRMESQGEVGRIQATETTYQILKDKFIFVRRGSVNIKGKGHVESWWLLKRK